MPQRQATVIPWRQKRKRPANTFIAQFQAMIDVEFEHGEPQRIIVSRDQDFAEFFVGVYVPDASRFVDDFSDPTLTDAERWALNTATADDMYDKFRNLPIVVI